MASSSCYVCINTTSVVKTYLDKRDNWLQISPKGPAPDWCSGLFSEPLREWGMRSTLSVKFLIVIPPTTSN